MERPLLDARHGAHAAPEGSSSAAASSSSSLVDVSLFPAPGARERALPANPSLASFPHEDVEPMRGYPPPSNAPNSNAGATSASSSAAATGGFRSVPLPRWSPSPMTPRYLAATTHQPPPPLGALLTGSAAGSGSTNVSSVDGSAEVASQYHHYEDDHRAAGSSGLEGLTAAAVVAESGNANATSSMTMRPALGTLPLPMTRPLVVPPPPPPAVVTNTSTALQTRKRKRIPGPMRMRNFLCMHPGCGKSFTDSAHLRDHTVVHTGEKKLSCPTCGKLFARASTLQEHIRVHTGEKPYVCGVPGCSKRYASRAAMRFHRSTHVLSAPLTPFACQECGKHFRVRELLMAHLKVHTAHRTAAAVSALTSLSPRGLARPSINGPNVDKHLHDTIRAQQDEIERLQAEVSRLRDEASLQSAPPRPRIEKTTNVSAVTAPVELLRDGYKPFECCICRNRFANFYQLTFHGKQHPEAPMTEVTGEQAPLPVGPKYCPEEECEYAESTGKSLRNLQTLKRHWQRRHQSERPYACSYCPSSRQKTFKTRENLKAHEKDCTKNVPVR
ncbi:hypothetical protein PHYSODRAFT_554737 [Phytophthora sojae]|uniref:C2H2-type domain-containing protein n=1 Tax=Phytophthora sojae (strain P6497) TaxID=1094619 RepID=G4Z085_PHYSP|nr:hypothetical protein PHYSODRAFT_554737 [Phytophthora sojae]EGZ24642.1 hypothetical protein PHYSODRAFT_554737 [Phytophthora sojae]|eukprot:XP_009519930.1 hypothetical protein PHYSODRAFT_554737 [Phytophthora sojae]